MLNATRFGEKQPSGRGVLDRPADLAMIALKSYSPGSSASGARGQGEAGLSPEAQSRFSEAMPVLRVLVLDDDGPVRSACCEIVTGSGYLVVAAETAQQARAILKAQTIDLLLLDMKLPGDGGLPFLKEVKSLHPHVEVMVMTAYASVPSVVESMQQGAGDYLVKPFALDDLTKMLDRAGKRRRIYLERRRLQDRMLTEKGMGEMIGRSPEMEKLYRILSKVAMSTHPVLILGESGTGKELVARSIHLNGPHPAKPFIPVDCGALVATLIESELFGYVKGAFTGANRDKVGLLAAAEGGTVFLDEIGELPLDLQAKLLRALQEKEVRPVGATRAMPFSARILAATNRDLVTMVEQGRFRKDLYYRLNVVNLKIPPLRERRGDIAMLVEHILARRQMREKSRTYTFSEDALRWLMEYDWPGNVRELEHAIEHMCALASGSLLVTSDMPTQLKEFRLQAESRSASSAPMSLMETQAVVPPNGLATGKAGGQIVSIFDMEKRAILTTIQQLRGDKLMAAKLLGIGKTTLYRKLKEYGIADEVD